MVDFLININSVVHCWDVSLNTGVLECSMVYGCVFHNGCVEAKLVLELELISNKNALAWPGVSS